MKKLIRVLILILAIGLLFKFGNLNIFKPNTVKAIGDLVVDFHVPFEKPIFEIFNMMPGDKEDRDIDVKNAGDDRQMVLVRAERKGGVNGSKFETALEIIIRDDGVIIYGPKKLSEFFKDTLVGNGHQLSLIDPGEEKSYNFEIIFPKDSGNEFQLKSVRFHLTIGAIVQEQIVINEVYYNTNKNFEWIELYNPSDKEVNLKNWTLTENSNKNTKISGDKKLKPNSYALIARENDVWENWDEDVNALKIKLGEAIGDGLDDNGDHLILRNSYGIEIDRMSWGDENPLVGIGSSTQRLSPGFDTDSHSDWHEKNPPTPGS